MKKKSLCIVLTAIMAGSMLAGCGSSSSTGSSTGSTDSAAAATQGSTEAAASDSGDASGATTLTWALWDESSTVYYQPLIDAFEAKHPDINVEMVDLGSTDYSTVLGTQLSGSDSSFDVVSIKDTPGYVTLVNKGVLEPLDDRISSDGIDLSKYSGVTDQLKVGDKLYELPFRSDIWVLMDFGSVIVHIFTDEARKFYDLERLWSDAEAVTPSSLPSP